MSSSSSIFEGDSKLPSICVVYLKTVHSLSWTLANGVGIRDLHKSQTEIQFLSQSMLGEAPAI